MGSTNTEQISCGLTTTNYSGLPVLSLQLELQSELSAVQSAHGWQEISNMQHQFIAWVDGVYYITRPIVHVTKRAS